MALFSSTSIFNSITWKESRFVDTEQSPVLCKTVFTQQRGSGRHTHLLVKEKPQKLLAAIPTFPLKHHKKQTEVKVKSFSKH